MDAALYLPDDEAWGLETRGAVLDEDPYDENDPVPLFALQHGLRRVLSVPQCQDIIANARAQVKLPTLDQLLSAFLFYYDHDAFICFE